MFKEGDLAYWLGSSQEFLSVVVKTKRKYRGERAIKVFIKTFNTISWVKESELKVVSHG